MDKETLMKKARSYREQRARKGQSHEKQYYIGELRHLVAVVVSLTIQNREENYSPELLEAYKRIEETLEKANKHVYA